MSGGNGTAGPPGLWLLALGVCGGDGPSLGRINSPQVKACPAKLCCVSTPNLFLFQGRISKYICLSKTGLLCSWDNVRTGTRVSMTAPGVGSSWWNLGYLGHFGSMMCPCRQWNNFYDLDILSRTLAIFIHERIMNNELAFQWYFVMFYNGASRWLLLILNLLKYAHQ